MFTMRNAALVALVLLVVVSTAFSSDPEEIPAVFLRIENDTLWVRLRNGKEKDYPLTDQVEFWRERKPCPAYLLQPGDPVRITIHTNRMQLRAPELRKVEVVDGAAPAPQRDDEAVPPPE